MPDVVGIRFKSCGKIYDFEVNGLEVKRGEAVVVESELGLSIGSVVVERHALESATKELKKVVRKATEDDFKQKMDNEGLEREARGYCLERIMARGLPMKLVSTEVTLDRKRIIFYFAADGRIDFRELVKDLAAKFKTRIEMRQIGVRDEAKIVGGLGVCGRELCCRTFLTSFEPISIKMAKSQELVLNANKLSGVCGRLMCCLSYEYSENGEGCSQCKRQAISTGSDEERVLDSIEDRPEFAEELMMESAEPPHGEQKTESTRSSRSDVVAGRRVAHEQKHGEIARFEGGNAVHAGHGQKGGDAGGPEQKVPEA
ncbi:MAG TPA: stage 0 sporulation family protein, partial [Thermodesulfovibrionales bacterium]|nr:stage 0 sporulation family protein [Thermodesulfovibrionales bacterium]